MKVSVVIPTFNGSRYLRETIDSALAQTIPPHEVIVVDDGSSDGTPGLVRGYATPVRLVEQANAGTAAARNTGLQAATGDFVAFLDHDDCWRPDKLRLQAAALQATGADGVYGSIRFFDSGTGATTAIHVPPGSIDFHAALGFEVISLQTLVCRATAAREMGGFDPSLRGTDDWDFSTRLLLTQRLVGLPDVLADIRIHEGQAGRQRVSMYRNCLRALEKNGTHHTRCTKCRVARKQARARINLFFYEHLREVIHAAGWRHPLRVAAALFAAVTNTPDQLLATLARKFARRTNLVLPL